MTTVEAEGTTGAAGRQVAGEPPASPAGSHPAAAREDRAAAVPPRSRRAEAERLGALAGAWILVTVLAVGVVAYGFGPLFQSRQQHVLMSAYKTDLYNASVTVEGPGSSGTVPLPPSPGQPVGILEIGPLRIQQVVVEGVGPSQTEEAPGHVPGTAGLGDPGNAVVVGRHAAFGGAFGRLGQARPGMRVLVTTSQGQSVYQVTQVSRVNIAGPASTASVGGAASPPPAGSGAVQAPPVPVDTLYGATSDNRLTLVTSASDLPWNTSKAVVVVAEMVGAPFAPTPQEARNDAFTGLNGSSAAISTFVLLLLGYVLVAVGAAVAYRRYSAAAAWFMTMAPLLALVVLMAEVGGQLLPAWL